MRVKCGYEGKMRISFTKRRVLNTIEAEQNRSNFRFARVLISYIS